MKLRALTLSLIGLAASAQAPMLQDGAEALRRARLDWTAGETPLGPSSLPSLEVGWGGAGGDGAYAPLVGGEGLAHGTRGWGLGLQGRAVSGGWSFGATVLGLRGQGGTRGILQRAALAYQTESGWRAALEQGPLAWGSGLLGGDLLGDAARAFPRVSVATPEVTCLQVRWRAEAFAGRLEGDRPIPAWSADRELRLTARQAGFDLQRPLLQGAFLRADVGPLVGIGVGTVALRGGRDARGNPAPAASARTASLVELKVRFPALARALQARGASLTLSRGATPDCAALVLSPARNLGGVQVVWDRWDLGLEVAGAAPRAALDPARPAYFAGFSSQGDPLASAFGREVSTRSVVLGLPLFLEGRGTVRVVRASASVGDPGGQGTWFLQGDAQWRTPTGRVGASMASRRDEPPGTSSWGWALSVFQAFRVF